MSDLKLTALAERLEEQAPTGAGLYASEGDLLAAAKCVREVIRLRTKLEELRPGIEDVNHAHQCCCQFCENNRLAEEIDEILDGDV